MGRAGVNQLEQTLFFAGVDDRDQPERIEQVEGAVDGGKLNPGIPDGNHGINLFGGKPPAQSGAGQAEPIPVGGSGGSRAGEAVGEVLFTRHTFNPVVAKYSQQQY